MNLKLFVVTSNSSCRKAIKWLNENNISYEEKNLTTTPITAEEIQEILALTNEGTEEIISSKSTTLNKMNIDMDSLSLPQLYEVIINNPGVLQLPIIHDKRRLQVGYNDDEIRQFLPRWFKINQLKKILAPFEPETHS